MIHSTAERLSDRRKMVSYVGPRVADQAQRIILADGPEGEVWVELFSAWDQEDGWDLHWETNLREWVDLREIYEHFRRQDMTTWEWQAGFKAVLGQERGRRTDSIPAGLSGRTAGEVTSPSDLPAQPSSLADLPGEVSTGHAAKILGISKDTLLKLKDDGLLEYRNAAPPSSSRPIYRFSLASALALRTTYRADSPAPFQKPEGPRRVCKGPRKYKHLRLSDD